MTDNAGDCTGKNEGLVTYLKKCVTKSLISKGVTLSNPLP